jgi:hypothetical protein
MAAEISVGAPSAVLSCGEMTSSERNGAAERLA